MEEWGLVGVAHIIIGIIVIVKRSAGIWLAEDSRDCDPIITFKGRAAVAIGVVVVIIGLTLVLWASHT